MILHLAQTGQLVLLIAQGPDTRIEPARSPEGIGSELHDKDDEHSDGAELQDDPGHWPTPHLPGSSNKKRLDLTASSDIIQCPACPPQRPHDIFVKSGAGRLTFGAVLT